ncbi:uncharacterized protein PgNI_09223 [Pyricularia grisea]|uniref:Uncharacterized protein n=1 Tax=Pyricularia grisea TaxID=148305 RepID=A0A6P8AS55_PYRGI|nr:uncharacterized protein PgNI_09223 [Pyricularia grisea]TLD04961.1 hypothetical protein PgNI_09223 [Pyricularia grisea]
MTENEASIHFTCLFDVARDDATKDVPLERSRELVESFVDVRDDFNNSAEIIKELVTLVRPTREGHGALLAR